MTRRYADAEFRELVPPAALWLGGGGLVPFAILPAVIWLLPSFELAAQQALLAYGAVILSFLGAVHWGIALTAPRWPVLAWSVAPALIGWISLALSPGLGLATQLLGLVACLVKDRQAVEAGSMPGWYGRLRVFLTCGAGLGLVAALVRIGL